MFALDHIGGGAPGAPEGPRGDRPPEGGPGGALPLPRVSQKTENRSGVSQIELARFALIPSPCCFSSVHNFTNR